MKQTDKLVIFDMDGVLINSEPAFSAAATEALQQFGVSAARSDFKEYTGKGDTLFIGGVAEKHGVKYIPEMKRITYDIYFAKAKERVVVFDWSRPLITELKKMGYKIAVASAADTERVMLNISCIGVSPDDFDTVVTGSEVTKNKPSPEIFEKAADKLGIEHKNAIVIEDAIAGIAAACAAGMHTIGTTTSFDAQTMKNSGAETVLDNLIDALTVIPSVLPVNYING